MSRIGSVQPLLSSLISLYRIEKDFMRNPNDSMQFSYASLTHNSSCEKEYVKTFIGRMGFRNQGIWAFYNQGSTTLADCLLGVRYFVSRFDSTDKPYICCAKVGEDYIYQNPYAFPMAFVANEQIKGVDMTQEDLFSIQNDIAKATGGKAIYKRINDPEVTTFNLQTEYHNIRNTGESGTKSDTTTEAVTYRVGDLSQKACVTYKVSPQKDCNVYCYFSAPYEQRCEFYKNEEDLGDYFSDFRWSIVNLGKVKAGSEVSVTLELLENELSIYNAYFYEEDTDLLKDWSESMLKNKIETKQITSSEYAMTLESKTDGLLVMDFAMEPDWKIYMDGERVNQKEVLGALMAVDVTKGFHELKMVYEPRGRLAGLVITVLCVILMMVLRTKNIIYKTKNKEYKAQKGL